MEKRSKHYGDVAKWLEKVIDSCETYQQTMTARKLVLNFRNQLQRKYPDKYWNDYHYTVISTLEHMLQYKRELIIEIPTNQKTCEQ
jgi:hypothetical protein